MLNTPENPISWGGNERLRCSMFGPEFLKSARVRFTGRSKAVMIAKSPEMEAVIGETESKNSPHVISPLKESAWPKHCLDDSLISPFGRGQSLACLLGFWVSFWWSTQYAMQEVRSRLFWQFGWRLSPGSGWSLSVGLAFVLWETNYYLTHNLE